MKAIDKVETDLASLEDVRKLINVQRVAEQVGPVSGNDAFIFDACQIFRMNKDWSHEALRQRHGETVIPVAEGTRLESKIIYLPLAKAIELFQGPQANRFYARQIPVPGPLLQDITTLGIQSLLSPDRQPIMNLWIGPSGTVQPFHKDNHNPLAVLDGLLVQLHGHKEVLLVSSKFDHLMYKRNTAKDFHYSEIDLLNFDKCRYSAFLDAEIYLAIIGPGDCLYIPANTWHHVRSLSNSVSLSIWTHREKLADRIFRSALLQDGKKADKPLDVVTESDVTAFGGFVNLKCALATLSTEGIRYFLDFCDANLRGQLFAAQQVRG